MDRIDGLELKPVQRERELGGERLGAGHTVSLRWGLAAPAAARRSDAFEAGEEGPERVVEGLGSLEVRQVSSVRDLDHASST